MSILEEALRLAENGIPVFPCRPTEKEPLTKKGFYDASTDEAQIRAWWKRWPNANLAVPTGRPGWDVLDVDVRASGSGLPALRNLDDAGLLSGVLKQVRTPSGGLHLYFVGTETGNGSMPKVHLDFRGLGGYVLVPPSYVVTETYKGTYEEIGRYPQEWPVPLDWEACKRLLQPVRKPRPSRVSENPIGIKGLVSGLARQVEGNRNNYLYWAARRAAEQGEDASELEDAALAIGLDEDAVRKTMGSAMKGLTR